MKLNLQFDTGRALRKAAREETVEALREGRKTRANTFVNRKRKADRLACRKGQW